MSVLAALCACTGVSPVATRQQTIRVPAYYLRQAQTDSLRLPPAPASGSDTDKADMATVHQWQEKRTSQECARALSEKNATFDQFFGAISPFQNPPPQVADFMARLRTDGGAATDIFKELNKRPRPFMRDKTVHTCVRVSPSWSYPSGHTVIARLMALALSDLAPARRAEFMARADEAALDRVIAGVHHPSDLAAGKQLADELYPLLLKNPAFAADMEQARLSLAK